MAIGDWGAIDIRQSALPSANQFIANRSLHRQVVITGAPVRTREDETADLRVRGCRSLAERRRASNAESRRQRPQAPPTAGWPRSLPGDGLAVVDMSSAGRASPGDGGDAGPSGRSPRQRILAPAARTRSRRRRAASSSGTGAGRSFGTSPPPRRNAGCSLRHDGWGATPRDLLRTGSEEDVQGGGGRRQAVRASDRLRRDNRARAEQICGRRCLSW